MISFSRGGVCFLAYKLCWPQVFPPYCTGLCTYLIYIFWTAEFSQRYEDLDSGPLLGWHFYQCSGLGGGGGGGKRRNGIVVSKNLPRLSECYLSN
jgi:hypothetical protein